MRPELRERRRRQAARASRRRLLVAGGAALFLHLLALPLLELGQRPGKSPIAPPPSQVSLLRVPAAQWEAAEKGAERVGQEKARLAEARPEEKREEEKRERERAPGQVVEVAPGNDEVDPNARFAAETSNRVERETIARNRAAGHPVTMPKPTVDALPDETAAPGRRSEGELAALGPPAEERRPGQEGGSRIEIPSVERRDGISLPEDRTGRGSLRNQRRSDEVVGNSDRFRVELGQGEGEGPGQGGSPEPGQEGMALRLFPSGATLDRIVGGPAPDHVEGVDEGEGTFLNTREWRHASFFNRVKRAVSLTWNPNEALRVRDPTGNIYAWKDRTTLVSVALRADGSLADVWVEKSSGVDFLDREAVAAFERAQPFPNPPAAMLDETGLIRFGFGFHIYSASTLRIFRRY